MNDVLRIMLAEDNAADVFLVRTALEREGFNFHLNVLSDGAQALRYLEDVESDAAPCPEILLVDLNLPKRNGEEILTKLRQIDRCSSVCVVVLSSSNFAKDKERAALLGATTYFVKPCDLEEFMKFGEVVREALKTKGVDSGQENSARAAS